MDSLFYVLRPDGTVISESDLHLWGQWMQTGERIIRQEQIGDCFLSSVFLGVDHNYEEHGPPVLFETMAFIGEEREIQIQIGREVSRADILALHTRTARLCQHWTNGGLTGAALQDALCSHLSWK